MYVIFKVLTATKPNKIKNRISITVKYIRNLQCRDLNITNREAVNVLFYFCKTIIGIESFFHDTMATQNRQVCLHEM